MRLARSGRIRPRDHGGDFIRERDVLASAWMDVLLATTRPSWPGHNTERLHEATSLKPPSMLKSHKLLPCCIPTQPTVLPQTFLSPTYLLDNPLWKYGW